MKKKIYVVCLGKITGRALKEQIDVILQDVVEVEVVLVSELITMRIECDFAVFTGEFLKRKYEKYMGKIPNTAARRLINYKNVEEIITLPPGTNVLLVNDAEHTAIETIEQLIEIGLEHVNYFPYYPNSYVYGNIDVAVTPGEAKLVPKHILNIIDIGIRQLDLGTIYEIALRLSIKHVFQENIGKKYAKDIIEISKKIEKSRKAESEMRNQLQAIINGVEDGIVYVNSSGIIMDVNRKFESIFSVNKKDTINKEFQSYISERQVLSKDNTSAIININGNKAIINYVEIAIDEDAGYLIIISLFDRISKLQSKIANKRNNKRMINNLSIFDDFITVNQKLRTIINRAEKFSKTNATILIQGENGVGKEIFAQSIHMNSLRKNNIFVPVNITSIPDKLIESELFGYEEGAFTGAQKGGKIGMFEMAHGGTIFIDEIGDATQDIQAKLLRVLQEKKIRRIGGVEEISIDIRVIVATNKDVLKLIDEGLFREDLFYRLSVLPLYISPLRDRKEDIFVLMNHFIHVFSQDKRVKDAQTLFTEDTLDFLVGYRWKGNVRELINLVEYSLLIYEGEQIKISMLPHYVSAANDKPERILLDEEEYWVLKRINEHESIGRTSLSKLAICDNVEIGEGKIRRIINDLRAKQLIVGDGKGCNITQRGKSALKING